MLNEKNQRREYSNQYDDNSLKYAWQKTGRKYIKRLMVIMFGFWDWVTFFLYVFWYLKLSRTSLVAQWLRIRLPMQRIQVSALVWEDPTCCGATKPVRHNYWACALEPTSHNHWACMPQLLTPAHLEPMLRNKRSHRNEKPAHHNEEKPPLASTTESPCAATKTQCSQK